MSESQIKELEASIKNLEASLKTADSAARPILEQQIENLRSTILLLRQVTPDIEAAKAKRPVLSAHLRELFTPLPPANVPAWIADQTTRGDITEEAMRCPPTARVYADATSVSCAIPGEPGASSSVAHGLALRFGQDGRLAEQTLYEHGLVRWSIGYHATGGRYRVGFYASTAPKTYPEHGLHTRYAPSGVVVAQTEWVNGTKHGWEKLWEEDGYPIVGVRYAAGKEIERVLPDNRANLS
jgi:hypothetical protein